jgi:hypothetical protein
MPLPKAIFTPQLKNGTEKYRNEYRNRYPARIMRMVLIWTEATWAEGAPGLAQIAVECLLIRDKN